MDHSVLERLSLGIFSTLITAASQDRVEDEDGNARDHENWILKQENDQVEIQFRAAINLAYISLANLEFIKAALLIILNEFDGDAHNDSGEDPLDYSRYGEPTIAANPLQEAAAESEVDDVVQAETTGHAAHLAGEAQIDQKVVVEQMEHCNDAADNAHREQDLALLFHFRFATDSVDEPSGAANHDDCQDSLENQLRELHKVEEVECKLLHLNFIIIIIHTHLTMFLNKILTN